MKIVSGNIKKPLFFFHTLLKLVQIDTDYKWAQKAKQYDFKRISTWVCAAWPIIYAVLKRQEIKQLSFKKKRQERWIKDKKSLCYCGRNRNAHQMLHLSNVSFGSSSVSQPLYGLWTCVTSFGQWNGSQRDLQSEGISSLCIIFSLSSFLIEEAMCSIWSACNLIGSWSAWVLESSEILADLWWTCRLSKKYIFIVLSKQPRIQD